MKVKHVLKRFISDGDLSFTAFEGGDGLFYVISIDVSGDEDRLLSKRKFTCKVDAINVFDKIIERNKE